MKKLSQRETQIVNYMSKGFNNKTISLLISIDQKTVSTYVQRIRKKLELDKNCNAYLIVATFQKINFPVTEEVVKND